MSRDKTLVVFTTNWIYPDSNEAKYLFNKARTEVLSTEPLLYRLKDISATSKIVAFAANPWDEKGGKEGRKSFLKSLLNEVKSNLDETVLSELKHIKLFLHRAELNVVSGKTFDWYCKDDFTEEVAKEVFNKDCNLELLTKEKHDVSENATRLTLVGYQREPNNPVHLILCDNSKEDLEKQVSVFLNILEELAKDSSEKNFEKTLKKVREVTKEFEVAEYKLKYNGIKKSFELDYSDSSDEDAVALNSTEKPVSKVGELKVVALNSVALWQALFPESLKELAKDCFYDDDSKEFLTTPVIFIIEGNLDKYNNLLDPCYRFLDSSIWCRYVIYEEGNLDKFEKDLAEVVETIKQAYKFDLYKKNVCKEYLEFQIRLLENSYLDGRFGGGHASAVTPFVFHSETEMRARMREETEKSKERVNGVKWNFLLIDDYAKKQLKEEKNRPADCMCPSDRCSCKENIIKHWLNDLAILYSSNEKKELFDKFETADTIKDGIEKMNGEEKVFDILLLDFLFSYVNDSANEYGYEFIEQIKKGEIKGGQSVLNSYWIFPITAFPDAFSSKLQEKGIQYIEDKWHIVKGADPINTPHLFQHNLLEFLIAQFNKVYFGKDDVFDFLINHKLENRKEVFRKFIERFSTIESINKEKSALGKTINNKMNRNEEDSENVLILVENIRGLLFYLAYSTGGTVEQARKYMNAIIHYTRPCYDDKEGLKDAVTKLSDMVYSIKIK